MTALRRQSDQRTDAEQARTIVEFALARLPVDGDVIHHLDNPGSVRRYQRKADEITALVGPGRSILDWGCLYGQMTFLLERRGLHAVPFDIVQSRRTKTLCELVGRMPTYSDDPIALPFRDASFDAVLSSGTLEHVFDPDASLQEVRRVLRPGGWFIIYNLPNRFSWIELIGRFRGTVHERRYGLREAKHWIERYGFEAILARYDNVLPCTLKGVPHSARFALHPIAAVADALDPLASRIPLLSMLATNLTLMFRKQG